jgi:hypothetical protein
MPGRRRTSHLLALLVGISVATAAEPLVATAAEPLVATAAPAGQAQLARQVLRGQLVAFAEGAAEDLGAAIVRVRDGRPQVAVSVELAVAATPAVLRALRSAGLDVRNAGGQLVDGYASADALLALSTDPAIVAVRVVTRRPESTLTSPAAAVLGATAWNTAGFTGAGVKVGIVDGGFDGIAALLGTTLPATITVRCYSSLGSISSDPVACENGEPHGAAVAESIADIAPGVSLYVADPLTPLETVQTVNWMTENGVRIINASWSSGTLLEGPGDGTSPYSNSTYRTVDEAVAGGALWVNSAGNQATSSWNGPWTDADASNWLEFSGSSERNSVQLGEGDTINVALRWTSDASDYGLSLYFAGSPVALSDDVQALSHDPLEFVTYTAPVAGTYDIAVQSEAGPADPRLRLMIDSTNDADLGISVPDQSLPSPADSANPGEITVGAVGVGSPGTIEPYSSQGPTTDGRTKPDLVAVDCASTTAFPQFCGTSQAAPFVSGAAALALEADPTLTPVALAALLRAHTTPLGTPTPNSTFGAGLLNLGASPTTEPTAVRFASPPASGIAGGPFAGQPALEIVDAQGRRVAAGSGSILPIAISVASGTGTLACDGGLSRPAVAGVAAFSGCAIDTAGSFTIRADATGLASATSVPFAVLPAGSPMPLTLSGPAAVKYPVSAAFTVGFLPPEGVARPVEIQASPDGVTWTTVASVTTDATGAAAATYAPRVSSRYRALFQGAADAPVEVSAARTLTVSRTLATSASVPSGRTIRRGSRVTLTAAVGPSGASAASAAVGPSGAGAAAGRLRIDVYRRVGTAWRLSRTVYRTLDGSGHGRVTIALATAGSWWLRPRADPTSTNAASAWASGYRYVVR